MIGAVDVPAPQARIVYEGKDISADISPYLVSVGVYGQAVRGVRRAGAAA